MIYGSGKSNVLLAITYGSRLYGTSTPASDWDFKAVTLPALDDLVLAKQLKVERFRFAPDGSTVADSAPMPDGGYEAEHTPIHKLVHDYLGGQAWAVEFVYAVQAGAHEAHVPKIGTDEYYSAIKCEHLCKVLSRDFQHKNLAGMIGFATKQTFDYVRRGERLNAARNLLSTIHSVRRDWLTLHGLKSEPRLDSVMDSNNGYSVLDEIAAHTGLDTSTVENNGKILRTLVLNGRSYTETTAVTHLEAAIEKMIDQYGERSKVASETHVEWKSLSHAVRVYQQVIELLETGHITFPRPNATELLKIRLGEVGLEVVKDLLRELDDRVTELSGSSALLMPDYAMRKRAELMLMHWLKAELGITI